MSHTTSKPRSQHIVSGTEGDKVPARRSSAAAASTEEGLFVAVQQDLMSTSGIVAAGLFGTGDAGAPAWLHDNFTGPVFETEDFRQTATEVASKVLDFSQFDVVPVPHVRNLSLLNFPVVAGDQVGRVLTVATTDRASEAVTRATEMAASQIAGWHERSLHQKTQQQLEFTAAVLDLTAQIDSADSFRAGCLVLVNTLKSHFGCEQVVLGLRRKPTADVETVAVSGLPDFDLRSDTIQQTTETLRECDHRDRLSIFPADRFADRDSLLNHQKLAESTKARRIISHPLRSESDASIGVLLVVEKKQASKIDPAVFLAPAASRLASSLEVLRRADSSLFHGRRRGITAKWSVRLLAAVVVFAFVLMLPVTDQVHCECQAEAEQRRLVMAPHEGLIEETFVEAGDVVQAGQLLARMDGREIRWELAGLTAEYEKANKERDTTLLTGDVAGSQRATLERQQLDARRQILQQRLSELDIVAPTKGLVLEAHLERVENAPVTIGQPLFDVAELNPLEIEVAIPDSDYRRIQRGDVVTVRLDGTLAEINGLIDRIHPQTEIVDSNNVFIATVKVSNDEGVLQPGMKGYARVSGQTVSLGWRLFHKPWEHFRRSLPF